MISARGLWRSAVLGCNAIKPAAGNELPATPSAGLADLADSFATQVERSQPRFEHRGEHRLLHQLVDGDFCPVTDHLLGLADRLVPIRCFVGALADPAEGEDFGELVLTQVLEHR